LAAFLEQITGKKQKGSGDSSLRMELIYRHKAEQDILIIKLNLNLYGLHLEFNESFLKGAQIFLLIDDNDTLNCGKIIDYKAGAGQVFGLEETAHLETDFAFLAKLATAKKLEYRVIGKRGKISEGEFSKSDVFRIKGFYNGLSKKYEGKPLGILVYDLDEAGLANNQLKVSDWFCTYNDKDEPEEDWKSPPFGKWIFTYCSIENLGKEGFRLGGRFNLESNALLQPSQGLTEEAVRAALKEFEVSEEFIQTVMERGAVV
jgi:hypothetical protein